MKAWRRYYFIKTFLYIRNKLDFYPINYIIISITLLCLKLNVNSCTMFNTNSGYFSGMNNYRLFWSTGVVSIHTTDFGL